MKLFLLVYKTRCKNLASCTSNTNVKKKKHTYTCPLLSLKKFTIYFFFLLSFLVCLISTGIGSRTGSGMWMNFFTSFCTVATFSSRDFSPLLTRGVMPSRPCTNKIDNDCRTSTEKIALIVKFRTCKKHIIVLASAGSACQAHGKYRCLFRRA